MSSIAIASIVFACIFGGALLGMFLRAVLPDHHLSPDSKDVVKLAIGVIATMAALLLGLLTASAKSEFDTQSSELRQAAVDVLVLDRTLANYGPETKEIRDLIRRMIALRLEVTWPESRSRAAQVDIPQTTPVVESVERQIRALTPQNDAQRSLQARALQICSDVLQKRWSVLGGAAEVPMPFLVMVVFWLTTIFASFGLFAPRNPTVLAVLAVSALSVSGAVFLILELNRPFEGLLKVSSAPLRYTLSHLGE